MVDPHVEWLQYCLETDKIVEYNQAPSIDWHAEIFTAQLKDNILTCHLTKHFASVIEARKEVEGVLLTWEIAVEI